MTVPLAGADAKCGFPSPAEDYLDNPLDFNELLVRNPAATFAVHLAGDSMLREVAKLPAHNLAEIIQDREGTVWLAAREDGLIRARAIPYRAITSAQGLPSNEVRTVTEDEAGLRASCILR